MVFHRKGKRYRSTHPSPEPQITEEFTARVNYVALGAPGVSLDSRTPCACVRACVSVGRRSRVDTKRQLTHSRGERRRNQTRKACTRDSSLSASPVIWKPPPRGGHLPFPPALPRSITAITVRRVVNREILFLAALGIAGTLGVAKRLTPAENNQRTEK